MQWNIRSSLTGSCMAFKAKGHLHPSWGGAGQGRAEQGGIAIGELFTQGAAPSEQRHRAARGGAGRRGAARGGVGRPVRAGAGAGADVGLDSDTVCAVRSSPTLETS